MLDIKPGHTIGEGERVWTVVRKVKNEVNQKLYLVDNGKTGFENVQKVIEVGLIGAENLQKKAQGKFNETVNNKPVSMNA